MSRSNSPSPDDVSLGANAASSSKRVKVAGLPPDQDYNIEGSNAFPSDHSRNSEASSQISSNTASQFVESSEQKPDSSSLTIGVSTSLLLYEILKDFHLVKQERSNGTIRLFLKPKKNDVSFVTTANSRLRSIFNHHIPDELKGDKKVRVHSGYIAFDSNELFERWRKDNFLNVADGMPHKKIVIIGAGNVAKEIARDLIARHDKEKIPCEIILLSRTKADAAFLTRDGLMREGFPLVIPSDDHSVLKDADLIFMTAGVKAGTIGASSRYGSLPFNIQPLSVFGDAIRKYARGDVKVINLTNPVEVSAKLLQQASQIPPENIFGSGVALDSIRYAQFISKKLELLGFSGDVKAIVVGQHEKSGMVFLREGVTINGKPIYSLVEKNLLAKEVLEEILNSSEQEAMVEGLNTSSARRSRGGACILPAVAAVNLGMALLYAESPVEVVAAVYTPPHNSDNPFGVSGGCFLGLPLKVDKRGVVVDRQYPMSHRAILDLQRVSDMLANDGTQITPHAIEHSARLNRMLAESSAAPILLLQNLSPLNAAKDIDSLVVNRESIQKLYKSRIDVDGTISFSVRKEFFSFSGHMLENLKAAFVACGIASEKDCKIFDAAGKSDGINSKVLTIPKTPITEEYNARIFSPAASVSTSSAVAVKSASESRTASTSVTI